MNTTKKYQIFDVTTLKVIAIISMVFDHVGDVFFPGVLWLRMVGRLAMPLFAFCIAEGYCHTRDKNRYLLRLGIFALISEAPFDLAFDGVIGLGHQNIMLTFFMSIIALRLFDLIRGEKTTASDKNPDVQEDKASNGGKYSVFRTILGIIVVIAFAVLALIVKADYTIFAVISVFLFYVLADSNHLIRSGVGVAFLALTRTMGYYCTTGLSFIPLAMYNGKRGRGLKWFFYAFYPGHLLVIFLIKKFVLKA